MMLFVMNEMKIAIKFRLSQVLILRLVPRANIESSDACGQGWTGPPGYREIPGRPAAAKKIFFKF